MNGRTLTIIGAMALALWSWQTSVASASPSDFLPLPAAPRPADNPTAAIAQQSAGFTLFAFDGYVLRDMSSFEIWLRGNRSHGPAILHLVEGSLRRAARQVRETSGVGLRVRTSVSNETEPLPDSIPPAGQIVVSIGVASVCPGFAGCARPRLIDFNASTGVATIQSGRIFINRNVRRYGPDDRDAVVAHELGHALGLDHFDGLYNNRRQVMHSTSYAAGGTYRAGDRNGLIALRPAP